VRGVGDHLVVHPAHQPDSGGEIRTQQQLFAPGGGTGYIDGRKNAPLLQSAGKVELDNIIHPGAGIDQAGTDDGQGPAVFDVAGRPKEPLGWVEGGRVNAA